MAAPQRAEGEPAAKRQRTSPEGAAPLSIVVTGLAGPVCTVDASTDWTILKVQEAIREKCKIPVLWQTLVKGDTKLALEVTVGTLTNAEELQLSLVRQKTTAASLRTLLRTEPESCGRVAEDLAWVLLHGESRFHAEARGSLFELAQRHAGRLGGMPDALAALVSLLAEGCNRRRRCGAGALLAVAREGRGYALVARVPRALQLLVALFMNGGRRGKEVAAEALERVAWNYGRSGSDTLEAMTTLVGLLTNGTERGQRVAARTLGTLARNPEMQATVAQIPDAIESLVALLKTGVALLEQEAARTLATLAENAEIRASIVGIPNAIELLIGLLSKNDTRCQQAAAQALGNLALSTESQVLIAQVPEALPSLVDLVANSPSDCQREASRVLSHLALNSCNHVRIAATPGALVSLEALLDQFARHVESNPDRPPNHELGGAAAAAADTLAGLAQNAEALALFGTTNNLDGLGWLMTLLQRGTDAGMEAAARALSTLAADPQKKVYLRRHSSAIHLLAGLLRKQGHQGQEAAARALWSLAGGHDFTKVFLGFGWLGIIPALVSLLQTGSVTARGGAAGTLHYLATHPKNLERIKSIPELVPALVALLQEGDEEGRREAAGALEMLEKDPAVRAGMEEAGTAVGLDRA